MSAVHDAKAGSAPVLVCLDALEPAAALGQMVPEPAAWHVAAAALLEHARGAQWQVVHVLPRRPAPGQGGWRPLRGLAPTPAEPVFHRDAPSAFVSGDFAAAARASGRRPLILMGMSVGASGLATAVDAAQLGGRVTVATDALVAPAKEWDGLRSLANLAFPDGRFELRLSRTDDLMKLAPRLRLIRGGRG